MELTVFRTGWARVRQNEEVGQRGRFARLELLRRNRGFLPYFLGYKVTKTWNPFRDGFQTSTDEERATRFPFPNPSPRAGNGREKSGAGAPKEVRRIHLRNSVNNSKKK